MGGKKGDKKEKKGSKKDKDENADEKKDGELEHIDRAFFELQINTLQQKLTRLRADNQQLQVNYQDAKKAYDQLELDRDDVVAFLKLSIQKCSDENRELQDRLKAFQLERAEEVDAYETKIVVINEDFKNKMDQLKSEITLLAGQLNALEEFRIQKEKLEDNFQVLEKKLEESERKYEVDLEQADRKVILVRHEYKKEVDRNLKELQQQFHETLDLRITHATKNLMREHFAVVKENNEFKEILEKYQNENEILKRKERESRLRKELSETTAKDAIEKSLLQKQLIKKLTGNCNELNLKLEEFEKLKNTHTETELQLEQLQIENNQISNHNQNLITKIQELSHTNETMNNLIQNHFLETESLREQLHSCAVVIKKVLNFEEHPDVPKSSSDRFVLHDELFYTLLQLLDYTERKISLDSDKGSFKSIYKKGDLGFVPSSEKTKRKVSIKLNALGQIKNEFTSSGQLLWKASTSLGDDVTSSSFQAGIFESIRDKQVNEKTQLSLVSSGDLSIDPQSEEILSTDHSELKRSVAQSRVDVTGGVIKFDMDLDRSVQSSVDHIGDYGEAESGQDGSFSRSSGILSTSSENAFKDD